MPEKIEPQLDEIRRRARRRLVGAVVLALAAAVLVPMLLESDPKPLGEDVSVKIPPVDEGKFVSKLGEKGKSADDSAPAAAIRPAPAAKSAVETPSAPTSKDAGAASKPSAAESSTQAPASAKPTIVPPISAPAKEPSAPTDAPSSTAATPQESKPPPSPSPAPSPAPAPSPSPSPSPAPAPAPPQSASAKLPTSPPPVPPAADASKASKPASGAFSVQLAAFSDDKGANALMARLKKAGHPAYTESFSSARGIVWRVRVGPYGTREAAEAARTRLKADGQDGIIATSN